MKRRTWRTAWSLVSDDGIPLPSSTRASERLCRKYVSQNFGASLLRNGWRIVRVEIREVTREVRREAARGRGRR